MKGSSSTIRIRVSILEPSGRSMVQRQGEHERGGAFRHSVALAQATAVQRHDALGERPFEARRRRLEAGTAEAALDAEHRLDAVRARRETDVDTAPGRGALGESAADREE